MLDYDPHNDLIAIVTAATDGDSKKIFGKVYNDEMLEPRRSDKPIAQVIYASGEFEDMTDSGRIKSLTTEIDVLIIPPKGSTDVDLTKTRNDLLKYVYKESNRFDWTVTSFTRFIYTGMGGRLIAESITFEHRVDDLDFTFGG